MRIVTFKVNIDSSVIISHLSRDVHKDDVLAAVGLKQDVPDCLLLMQVGAFMQVMDHDARTVSQVTGLKLQMAGEVDDPVVVGGFPRSGLDAYVGKLVRAGHSVAVAVQLQTRILLLVL